MNSDATRIPVPLLMVCMLISAIMPTCIWHRGRDAFPITTHVLPGLLAWLWWVTARLSSCYQSAVAGQHFRAWIPAVVVLAAIAAAGTLRLRGPVCLYRRRPPARVTAAEEGSVTAP